MDHVIYKSCFFLLVYEMDVPSKVFFASRFDSLFPKRSDFIPSFSFFSSRFMYMREKILLNRVVYDPDAFPPYLLTSLLFAPPGARLLSETLMNGLRQIVWLICDKGLEISNYTLLRRYAMVKAECSINVVGNEMRGGWQHSIQYTY